MPEKLSLIHLAALRLERQYRFYYWDHVVHLKGFRNHNSRITSLFLSVSCGFTA